MAGRLTEQLRKATREQSRLHPVDTDDVLGGGDGETETGRAHSPFGWVSLLVVAVLVVGGWFVIRQLQADSKMQDCVMSGRKNCAPVDTDSMHGTSTPP
jgi:hypothetical protein